MAFFACRRLQLVDHLRAAARGREARRCLDPKGQGGEGEAQADAEASETEAGKRSRSRRMRTTAIKPSTTAATVPTTVKAPTMAKRKLARAKLLVRRTGRRKAGALSGCWHSGQATDWPARASSTSNRAPQSQVSDNGMVCTRKTRQPPTSTERGRDAWLYCILTERGRNRREASPLVRKGKERTVIRIRKAQDRGHADHGWLNTYHTFSFADYQDSAHMGFSSLRVINEDRVAPGMGFGAHAHRDMEIVSYVLEGELEHKDSMGNGAVLRPGEFQRISAGTGIRHSEFNPSTTEPVHFYQIWLLPQSKSIPPSYEQKFFDEDEKRGKLRLVASPDGVEGSLTINQDAKIYLSTLRPGDGLRHEMPAGRRAWLQVLRGQVSVNGTTLETSDGLAVSDETELAVVGEQGAEVMLFDLP